LSQLSTDYVKVLPCLSPIDRLNLPYFGKYLKKELLSESTNCLCIPLCDGVQGYIIDKVKHSIIHIDSLRPNNPENPTSIAISKILLDSRGVSFVSGFSEIVQFDSNSCGIWLVAGFCCHILGIPLPTEKREAYENVANLLQTYHDKRQRHKVPEELLSEINVAYEITPKPGIDKYATAEFLVEALIKN